MIWKVYLVASSGFPCQGDLSPSAKGVKWLCFFLSRKYENELTHNYGDFLIHKIMMELLQPAHVFVLVLWIEPLSGGYIFVSKTSMNIHAWVESECFCPCTVNMSNVNFTTKISILLEPVFKYMGQQLSGTDNSSSTPPVGYLSLSNTYVHKNAHSWVKKECCCPHIVNITNVKFSSALIYRLFYFARIAKNIIDN